MSTMLSSLLTGAETSKSHATLVVLTDSLLQPGLLLLNQLTASTLSRDEHVILLALEQSPTKLLPKSYSSSRLVLIDCVSLPPFASTSSLSTGLIDLDTSDGFERLLTQTCESIERQRKSAGSKVTVVLDSVDSLAEYGVDKVFRLVKHVLKGLDTCLGSRFILLHHSSFPSPSPGSTSPSLISTLLSPTLSASTVHLTLHPSPLIELFSREYGLAIPLVPSTSHPLDLRVYPFITSFCERSWGTPFLRPVASTVEDERLPLDLLAQDSLEEGGGCVVEYSARGIAIASSASGGAKRGEVKKVVARGLEGLKKTGERVEAVGLHEVLKSDRMARVTVVLPSAAEATTVKVAEPLLPFNLSLTDSQKSAREAVVLPYLPREDGTVDYTPDEGDNMDEDDPDEDLEI